MSALITSNDSRMATVTKYVSNTVMSALTTSNEMDNSIEKETVQNGISAKMYGLNVL